MHIYMELYEGQDVSTHLRELDCNSGLIVRRLGSDYTTYFTRVSNRPSKRLYTDPNTFEVKERLCHTYTMEHCYKRNQLGEFETSKQDIIYLPCVSTEMLYDNHDKSLQGLV